MMAEPGIAGLAEGALAAFVQAVLAEDLGAGDATSNATIPADMRFSAVLAARQPIVLAGLGFSLTGDGLADLLEVKR